MTQFLWIIEGFPTTKFGTVRQKVPKKVVIVCYSKFFRYQNISELQGSPYENFWYCETKTINKIVISLLFKNFWNQNNSKHRRVRPRWFLAMWDKKTSKKCDTPIIEKVLIPEHLWNTEGSPTMFFGNLGPKNFDGKTWQPLLILLIQKLFPY